MDSENVMRTGGEDGVAPGRSEDRMLLEEANHRAANEVAAALAAMRLARGARVASARRNLMDSAIERLEGYGDCCRIFCAPVTATTDVGAVLDKVCRALVRSRLSNGPSRVVLNLAEIVVPGEVARRIALIAHELVTNAVKHAFRGRGGELEVRLEPLVSGLVLSVIDDGPGLGKGRSSMTTGTRLGGGIVGELVRSIGGSMECDSGPGGTAIHVMLPLVSPAAGTNHNG